MSIAPEDLDWSLAHSNPPGLPDPPDGWVDFEDEMPAPIDEAYLLELEQFYTAKSLDFLTAVCGAALEGQPLIQICDVLYDVVLAIELAAGVLR